MVTQRFRDLHLRPCAFVAVAGYAPAVPLLHDLHRFLSRVENFISDCPSRSLDLTNNKFLTNLDINFPQPLPWKLWTPPPKLVSGIDSAL